MGSGALRLGCNLRKENPAPQARHGCRLSLPAPRGREVYAGSTRPAGQPAFMRTCRIRGVRRLLWKAVRLLWAVTCVRRPPPVRAEKGAGSACPAPAALARRGMGAGSACPAPRGRELYAGSTRPRPPHWRGAEEHAGATRRAQPAAGNFKGRGKKSAFGRQKGGRGGGRRLILDLDNTIRQGRGGYFDHTAHQAVRRRI